MSSLLWRRVRVSRAGSKEAYARGERDSCDCTALELTPHANDADVMTMDDRIRAGLSESRAEYDAGCSNAAALTAGATDRALGALANSG